ncbi:MAG TPA: hypothetical protein DCS48_03660 [Desulfovibrio sp.]|nr:hypothetical protein [Desulfovibrio sp.]
MVKKIIAVVLVFAVTSVAALFVLRSRKNDTKAEVRAVKSENLSLIDSSTIKQKNGREEAEASKEAEEIVDGVSYTKINVYELFDICERKDAKLIGDHFVMRGVVFNESQLGKDSPFVLMRHNLWCCEDHAISFGFRIDTAKAESLENGQWVKVYGKLEKGQLAADAEFPSTEQMKKINLPPSIDIEKNWIFSAVKVEKVSAPEQLYITYWNTKKPFYY